MGLETRCEVRWQGNTREAAVHLDSTALEVRGRPRLVVPLKQIRSVHPAAGELALETDEGPLTLVSAPRRRGGHERFRRSPAGSRSSA